MSRIKHLNCNYFLEISLWYLPHKLPKIYILIPTEVGPFLAKIDMYIGHWRVLKFTQRSLYTLKSSCTFWVEDNGVQVIDIDISLSLRLVTFNWILLKVSNILMRPALGVIFHNLWERESQRPSKEASYFRNESITNSSGLKENQ